MTNYRIKLQPSYIHNIMMTIDNKASYNNPLIDNQNNQAQAYVKKLNRANNITNIIGFSSQPKA